MDYDNTTKLTQVISLKMSIDDVEELKAFAKREGWTVSKAIRYCLFIEGVTFSVK